MYNREQRGKFHIMLCATTPCMVCGAYDIMHTIEAHLGIKGGQTTDDGLFTLTEVECLGACVNAPMVQVNDMFFENLTPENTIALLDNLRDGKPVVIGPQNGPPAPAAGPAARTFGAPGPAAPSSTRSRPAGASAAALLTRPPVPAGLKNSEGPQGRTTLKGEVRGPYAPNLEPEAAPPPAKPPPPPPKPKAKAKKAAA